MDGNKMGAGPGRQDERGGPEEGGGDESVTKHGGAWMRLTARALSSLVMQEAVDQRHG